MQILEVSPTLKARFLASIEPRENGCIEWKFSCEGQGGYGRMKAGVGKKGKLKLAHHISWFLKHGYWPELLMHSCDNRRCVRLAHLSEGTHARNNADMRAKGRAWSPAPALVDVCGEMLTINEIAARAGTTRQTIEYRIARGLTGEALMSSSYRGPRKPYTRRPSSAKSAP